MDRRPRDRRRRLHRLQLRPPRHGAHRRHGHGARQAHLRRAAASRSQGLPEDRVALVRRRHRRRPTSSTRSSPSTTRWCTSRPSRTTTTRSHDPSPFVRTNLVGTFTLLEAVAQARHPAPPHLHRRGVRRPRARRPRALHRGHAVQPVAARTPPPRPAPTYLVRAWVRSFGVQATISQLLEQLRPLAAHREVHPPPDHQRHRRRPAQALRRRPQRPRLDPRRRPLLGRAGRSSTRAGSARPT